MFEVIAFIRLVIKIINIWYKYLLMGKQPTAGRKTKEAIARAAASSSK